MLVVELTATPQGLVPTEMVAVTVLFEPSITDTEVLLRFAT